MFKVSVSIESQSTILLLVINSNIGPILHRFRYTATYWPIIAKFSYPFSFSALARGDPFQIIE